MVEVKASPPVSYHVFQSNDNSGNFNPDDHMGNKIDFQVAYADCIIKKLRNLPRFHIPSTRTKGQTGYLILFKLSCIQHNIQAGV